MVYLVIDRRTGQAVSAWAYALDAQRWIVAQTRDSQHYDVQALSVG